MTRLLQDSKFNTSCKHELFAHQSWCADVRSPAGATRLGSGELPGQHHDPEEAPAVLEALMQSMVQYRRRLDQQGASQGSLPTARSYGAVQGGAPRPRSALSRHSDVSAVLSRAASNTGPSGGVADNGAAGESTATPSPGEILIAML